jgi:hypothetical protein
LVRQRDLSFNFLKPLEIKKEEKDIEDNEDIED